MLGGELTRRQLLQRGALGAGALATSSLWLPELSFGAGTTITNLVANPRVANALTGWDAYAENGVGVPTILRRTDDGLAPATTCAEITFTSTSPNHRGAVLIGRSGPTMSCTPGQVLWAQAAGKMISGDAGAELWLTIAYLDLRGNFLTEVVLQKLTATPGAWQALRGFHAAPTMATRCYVGLWLAKTTQVGSVFRATDALVTADPPTMPSYFDGDQPGCSWTGTPNASTSTGPVPTPAAPARSGFLAGWNDNSVLQSGWTPAADAALNVDIGMTVLRVGCDLRGGWVTGNTSTIDFNAAGSPAQKIDQLNTLCAQSGIKLLPIPLGAPSWMVATGADTSKINPPAPAHYADWSNICTQMATRWASNLAGIEIWNEENLGYFWAPGPNAADYTNLLIAASNAVRTAAPGVRVIVGGLGGNPNDNPTNGDIGVGNYIDQMVSHGAKGHYDGMAVHPYPGSVFTGGFDDSMRATRAAMARAADSSPIWVTEVGISTTGGLQPAATEAQQATVDRLLYAMLKRQSDVQAVCWHTSVSGSQWGPTNSETGFEFVERTTGRHKPVYDAIKSEIAGEP